MRKVLLTLLLAVIAMHGNAENFICVNQLGYLCRDVKVAVLLMQQPQVVKDFTVTNVATGKQTKIKKVTDCGEQNPFVATARLDFSQVTAPGEYYLSVGATKSPRFRIGDDVYAGAQEIPLYYMRQQRCGFNPFLGDSCHTHDGRLVLSGEHDGEHIDVTGGWHDASDFLQYLTTSANATYQMLFAYAQNPSVWQDNFQANGTAGSNGIPDILDEVRWGIEWMLKMNPNDTLFLNQIADDRDHRWAGLPQDDNVDYGWGAGMDRPVYPCLGTSAGLRKYKNKSRGLASSVAKFSSTFSLAAQVLEPYDPILAALLREKASVAYRVALANPGNCQTCCTVSPYYYEEDNWVDDMELAAATLYCDTRKNEFLDAAIGYERREPVTPWMGADSARHYQWYPFVNLGHAMIAQTGNERQRKEALRNMRSGLQRVADRARGNAFLHGIPFIWCSNNLTVAFVTQAMLYRDLSGDTQFQEIETAMRDWLFGVNPWGKCMIIGLPENGDWPRDPHSTLSNHKHYPITGGLVDGPVYTSIFNQLEGVHLRNEDKYAAFQSTTAVYHDDYSDYSTNEPTMDGTASTTWFLSRLASNKR